MRNIRLLIEYDGTDYAGWQWQKNDKTIQETISKAIEQVVHEPIKIYGASRTDAGVHALGQVANFHTASDIPSERLLHAINFHLPHDITIKDARDVAGSFHAQYDAQSKVYQYTLLNNWIRSSLNRDFCYVSGFQLDMDRMIAAARHLIGTRDFTSFTTKAWCEKNRIRTVKELDIEKEGQYVYFTVEANGFLYNMVRTIVGTLIEIGRGKIAVEHMKDILDARNRNLAGPTAPAMGLCLMKVRYENDY
ncbi:MAG: tRNA pseudouridine(38-40) synthase TruA [Candidatus Brocadia sp. AMX2]|uniref:tRNA pseudouridine synthase A n=1 Tax=Candidatus Brocadia sinica JPN1 TaxID=1197129 RepID=A0ABQ0K0E3_9BACT|nr:MULTISPECIES: tRNA pseudouridine(38-40) synthase TruA [Brocadia]KXK29137.1 MAG: tRNA pseudouridine synthase [Candidatus Brocadia sinica]MBC6933583.1 tRNA pseudouridine(38-40) synthase TruA [Candidatus Brocadia sp.]MBL1170384.1 tRNA pseudouridine(38-40) synthase TruA [Candidatus Brocadia sp. AMX1]NOG42311.1 tRNA pseudouridine(38-40) synthase TruA [Planctomycetota bacterium]KAA0241600.1 MAG: tRNA pseudouridine(38-40) synthase TruA [Candidatus Brocadia sp. AMX2]